MQINSNNTKNNNTKNNNTKNNNININIENFDGIKKDNARLIFGILLSFIILDLIYTMAN
jgi:hypothetical protein